MNKAVIAWADRSHNREGVRNPIYDLCFRTDGAQVIAAAGSRVLVYDAQDGDLIQSLKGHKDKVYCVAYSRDGKRFASGSADKCVIIWTNKLEGILRYSHNEAIQCLAYNPVTQQLVSCTKSDFGLWSPEQKNVQKHKVSERINCCCWTNDGQHLALGKWTHVSICDKEGSEKVKIDRKAPVWSLQWNPNSEDNKDTLTICDWNQKLSFYQLSGKQVGKDKELDFDPCSVGYFTNGEYFVVGGSDKKVTLWTKDGIKLSTVGEREGWVWCCRVRPHHNAVAVGCNDGTISMYQLHFSTVHGLYHDRYAYRDYMTDVIIQHLTKDQKVRIKCRDLIRKIAIYRDRLAVQLGERIIIYELFYDENDTMHYRVRDKINKKLECNLLVVTSMHIILCQEKRLQLYTFSGSKEREWLLDSLIRYIKVIGGPNGREGLLVGLKSGVVLKILIDNPFPIQLIKVAAAIRCLDISANGKYLAVVDENSHCSVYDMATKTLRYTETGANSVAFNVELDDMLCFSGNNTLSIKAGNFPTSTQKLQGFVVGFKGSKIFCLHIYAMQTIDVPQSSSLHQYLENKDFDAAYQVACLGVTDSDWQDLAIGALEGLNLDVARRAFVRVRNVKYLQLIDVLNRGRAARRGDAPEYSDEWCLADIYAFQGRFKEAARILERLGLVREAVDLFSDMRLWDQATELAKTHKDINIKELLEKQALTSRADGDISAAADMYLSCGDVKQAITLYGQQNLLDKVIEIARSIPKTDTEYLQQAAAIFVAQNHHQYAMETYLKLNDISSLLALHVKLGRWSDAFALVETHPERARDVWEPYAFHLAVTDNFEEAQAAFIKAGMPQKALDVLEILTRNAVREHRFADAAYYFWKLSSTSLQAIAAKASNELSEEDSAHLAQFKQYRELSEIYYVYNFLYHHTVDPFSSLSTDALFNMARFLLTRMTKTTPPGISKVSILTILGKKGEELGAFKLARYAYEKLSGLVLSEATRENVDLDSVVVRAKEFADSEDIMPLCFRCSQTNQILSKHGDACSNCHHPFVHSFHSLDILPLVEFVPEDQGIRPSLLMGWVGTSGPKQGNGEVDTLNLEEEDDDEDDEFTLQMSKLQTGEVYTPLIASETMIRSIPSGDCYQISWGTPAVPTQFFRSVVAGVPVHLCRSCNHFFHRDDWEYITLSTNACPLCRSPINPSPSQPNKTISPTGTEPTAQQMGTQSGSFSSMPTPEEDEDIIA
eukprot:GCRY01001970.1.p1 GENE.GCRY01001970.1~~GCRY01001970.1.p1  ORF type:complete len:1226 (+),score=346.97 GCRY01001970.1:229-3906(+)